MDVPSSTICPNHISTSPAHLSLTSHLSLSERYITPPCGLQKNPEDYLARKRAREEEEKADRSSRFQRRSLTERRSCGLSDSPRGHRADNHSPQLRDRGTRDRHSYTERNEEVSQVRSRVIRQVGQACFTVLVSSSEMYLQSVSLSVCVSVYKSLCLSLSLSLTPPVSYTHLTLPTRSLV